MADTTGPTPADNLTEKLIYRGDQFDLYHAIRLLNCRATGSPLVGEARLPSQEKYRFAQHVSLAFPRSAIEQVQSVGGGKIRIITNGFGLLGPNGPMPLQLTQHVMDRSRHFRDDTHREFLNLFHHRLMTLFYRAWANSQQYLSVDVAAQSRESDLVSRDRFGFFIGSLIGLGMSEFCNRDQTDDHAKLFFAGSLTDANRSPQGLEKLLTEFFGVAAKCQEFVMRWITVAANFRCRLGASAATGLLGKNLMLGAKFRECQSTFCVRMGPMSLARYRHLLPGQTGFSRLRDWIRLYAGVSLDWQIQYVLLAAEVPPTVLGRSGALGQTTWLQTRGFKTDADDYTYTHNGV